MKKFPFYASFAGLIIILILMACKKEMPVNSSPATPDGQSTNTKPKADAGQDIELTLPVNYCTLNGSASSPTSKIISYEWKKISGPTSCILERSDSLITKVNYLEKGIYKFELTVATQNYVRVKDTLQVTVKEDTTTRLVDVYVAGSENNMPVYWKNGQAILLSNDYYQGFSIAVNGNDIAVAQSTWGLTWDEDASKYWKNGQETKLGAYSQATSIALRDRDVFVAGWELDVSKGIDIAKYWKNGHEVLLTNGTKDAFAHSIAIVGNDIYVAGEEGDVAKYWKNGQAISLTDGKNQAYAYSIVVVDGDVYVAGSESNGYYSVAKYWKNGHEVLLTNGTKDAFATSIAVEGKNVYVAGYEGGYYNSVAKFWKNGQEVLLTNGVNPEIAESISVHNNDVYIAITEYHFKTNDGSVAKYWKNGQIVSLSDNGTAYSVLVVDH